MYKLEMHSTFRRIVAVFNEFGSWQKDGLMPRKLFYLFNLILFQILIVACAWISWKSDDKSETLFLAQVEITALVMTVKLVFLLWNKDTILLFLSDPIVTHSISDYAVFVQVKKKIKKFMQYVHVYIALMALVVLVLIVSSLPMFSSDKMLPLFIVYKFDWEYNEIVYWMIYSPLAFQIFLIFVINLLTVLIWYIMLNCSIKYQILGNLLVNLGVPKATDFDIQNISETESATNFEIQSISVPESDFFEQELIKLVEMHQRIFNIIERFRCSFSGIFIAQIVTSCVSICSSNYILANSYHDNSLQLAAYILTLLYGIVNIFVVMYLGNSIKLESDQLSYCLFHCNWIEQSKSARKCVLIFGEVLKKPHELTILKVFPMNLITFATIVNFAYAMFNLLKSIY